MKQLAQAGKLKLAQCKDKASDSSEASDKNADPEADARMSPYLNYFLCRSVIACRSTQLFLNLVL